MDRNNLILFMDDILKTAKEILKKEGSVCPMAFFIKEGSISVFPINSDNEAGKGLIKVLIKKIAEQTSPEAVVTVMEAWFVKVKKGDNIVGPVRNHPEKMSCLFVSGTSPSCRIMKQVPFEKKEAGFVFEDNPYHERFKDSFLDGIWENPRSAFN